MYLSSSQVSIKNARMQNVIVIYIQMTDRHYHANPENFEVQNELLFTDLNSQMVMFCSIQQVQRHFMEQTRFKSNKSCAEMIVFYQGCRSSSRVKLLKIE